MTAPELAAILPAQLTTARLVVIDLDGVQFFGPAGLRVFFEANDLAVEQDCDLRLVCHSRMVNRALEVTELRERFIFADTVSDALEGLP